MERVGDRGTRRHMAVPARRKERRVIRFGEHPPVVAVAKQAPAGQSVGGEGNGSREDTAVGAYPVLRVLKNVQRTLGK